MAGFFVTKHFDRPPEDVFRFMTDLEKLPTWLPDVVNVEMLTEGPVTAGARFRETRKVRGREAQADIEITEYDVPRRFVAHAAEGGLDTTYVYTFEPEHGGTQVDLVCEVKGRGLMKLLAPMVARTLRRHDGEHLAMAKAAIESGPSAASG